MKKNGLIKRASALLLALLTGFTAMSFPQNASASTAVASVGKSGVYKWKWTYCDTFEKVKSTGFLDRTYDGNFNNVKGDYSLILADRNSSSFFTDTPSHDNEKWWGSGDLGGSNWFNSDGKPFITPDNCSDALIEHTASVSNKAAFSMKIFFENSKVFMYYDDGTINTMQRSDLIGLSNNGDVNWNHNKGKNGEDFSVYFSNADSIPKSSDFYGSKGKVKIFEHDNNKYIWATGDSGQSVYETTSDKKEATLFSFWIGHFENIPGIPVGDYNIPEGKTLTMDDELTLVPDGATLTVSKDAVLYVKGELYVEGYIKNYGTIIVEDGARVHIGNTGTYGAIYTAGGKNQNGNFVISKGGTLKYTSQEYVTARDYRYTRFICTDGNFTNNGTVNFMSPPYNVQFSYSEVRLLNNSRVVIPSGYTSYDKAVNTYFVTGGMRLFSDEGVFYSGTIKVNSQ